MKNVIFTVLVLVVFKTTSQNDVITQALKGDELITYAADNFPIEDPQQIYILVETGTTGLNTNSIFYIKKGIALLTKRLNITDKIAIGVYGKVNGLIVPYTPVSSIKVINENIESLIKGNFTVVDKDGIDIAYEYVSKNTIESIQSSVLLLRGTGGDSRPATLIAQKSAYDSPSTEVLTNETRDTDKIEIQRTQAKAANHPKLGGAIALTALTILPELIDIIKD